MGVAVWHSGLHITIFSTVHQSLLKCDTCFGSVLPKLGVQCTEYKNVTIMFLCGYPHLLPLLYVYLSMTERGWGDFSDFQLSEAFSFHEETKNTPQKTYLHIYSNDQSYVNSIDTYKNREKGQNYKSTSFLLYLYRLLYIHS